MGDVFVDVCPFVTGEETEKDARGNCALMEEDVETLTGAAKGPVSQFAFPSSAPNTSTTLSLPLGATSSKA